MSISTGELPILQSTDIELEASAYMVDAPEALYTIGAALAKQAGALQDIYAYSAAELERASGTVIAKLGECVITDSITPEGIAAGIRSYSERAARTPRLVDPTFDLDHTGIIDISWLDENRDCMTEEGRKIADETAQRKSEIYHSRQRAWTPLDRALNLARYYPLERAGVELPENTADLAHAALTLSIQEAKDLTDPQVQAFINADEWVAAHTQEEQGGRHRLIAR